jgi:hypothetical protein
VLEENQKYAQEHEVRIRKKFMFYF